MLNDTGFLDSSISAIISGPEAILHTISQILLWPVIILLIIFFIYAILNIGILIAEYYKRYKEGIGSEDLKKTILNLNFSMVSSSDSLDKEMNFRKIIYKTKTPQYSKIALNLIIDNKYSRYNLDFEAQKSLAREIVEEEEFKLFKKLEKTDIVAKISPALGLMGTLIPLGPGLLALGSGDTQTLADSLIIAFDTTVLGMASASIAYVISKIRKRWYIKDIDALDNLAESILRVLNDKKKKKSNV